MLMTSTLRPCLRKTRCSTPIHMAAIFSLNAPWAMRTSGRSAAPDRSGKINKITRAQAERNLRVDLCVMGGAPPRLRRSGVEGQPHLSQNRPRQRRRGVGEMGAERVVMGAGDFEVFAGDAALPAEREKFLRLVPPAPGLGAADGDGQRRARERWMEEGAVFPRALGREADLLVDADIEHGVEVVDSGDRGRAFDDIRRQPF